MTGFLELLLIGAGSISGYYLILWVAILCPYAALLCGRGSRIRLRATETGGGVGKMAGKCFQRHAAQVLPGSGSSWNRPGLHLHVSWPQLEWRLVQCGR